MTAFLDSLHGTAPHTTALASLKVAVLLSTHNGARFLREQLDSIIAQTHNNWLIVASDDGSTDATLSILEDYRNKLGSDRLQIRRGPCRGYVANFLSIATDKSIDTDVFAFADQDDVWHPDKLQRAIAWLSEQPEEQPSLYCSRTRLINASGQPFGCSPLFSKPPSFRNALVQSLAGGNTMIFNKKTRELLTRFGNVPVVSHDWWLYILTSGSGGVIKYDPIPSIDYRQHGANLIGSNATTRDRLHRLKSMLAGNFNQWNDINLSALRCHKDILTQENRDALEWFIKARYSPLPKRLHGLLRSGIYRQTHLDNLGLITAAILGKI